MVIPFHAWFLPLFHTHSSQMLSMFSTHLLSWLSEQSFPIPSQPSFTQISFTPEMHKSPREGSYHKNLFVVPPLGWPVTKDKLYLTINFGGKIYLIKITSLAKVVSPSPPSPTTSPWHAFMHFKKNWNWTRNTNTQKLRSLDSSEFYEPVLQSFRLLDQKSVNSYNSFGFLGQSAFVTTTEFWIFCRKSAKMAVNK